MYSPRQPHKTLPTFPISVQGDQAAGLESTPTDVTAWSELASVLRLLARKNSGETPESPSKQSLLRTLTRGASGQLEKDSNAQYRIVLGFY